MLKVNAEQNRVRVHFISFLSITCTRGIYECTRSGFNCIKAAQQHKWKDIQWIESVCRKKNVKYLSIFFLLFARSHTLLAFFILHHFFSPSFYHTSELHTIIYAIASICTHILAISCCFFVVASSAWSLHRKASLYVYSHLHRRRPRLDVSFSAIGDVLLYSVFSLSFLSIRVYYLLDARAMPNGRNMK